VATGRRMTVLSGAPTNTTPAFGST
jgi:hypothetical protein